MASLTCQRCGRSFTARRSDARFCSRSCRRRLEALTPSPIPAETEELDGWRRVPGGGIIPPADSRLTVFVDHDALRRL
jgi:hypothetical protein